MIFLKNNKNCNSKFNFNRPNSLNNNKNFSIKLKSKKTKKTNSLKKFKNNFNFNQTNKINKTKIGYRICKSKDEKGNSNRNLNNSNKFLLLKKCLEKFNSSNNCYKNNKQPLRKKYSKSFNSTNNNCKKTSIFETHAPKAPKTKNGSVIVYETTSGEKKSSAAPSKTHVTKRKADI